MASMLAPNLDGIPTPLFASQLSVEPEKIISLKRLAGTQIDAFS